MMTNCLSCKWYYEEDKTSAEQLGGICKYPDEHFLGCFVPFDFSCKHYEVSTIKSALMQRTDALEAVLQIKCAGKINAAACFAVCSALYRVPTTGAPPRSFASWGYKEWGIRYCTNCGFEPAYSHDEDLNWDTQCTSRYCPHCGATMCKEEDYHET